MRKAATDRASIADRGMSDLTCGFRQQRRMRGDLDRFQEIGVARQRANRDAVTVDRDAM